MLHVCVRSLARGFVSTRRRRSQRSNSQRKRRWRKRWTESWNTESTASSTGTHTHTQELLLQQRALLPPSLLLFFLHRQLIYNYPEQLFAQAGVMAIEHADFAGVERLALVTGVNTHFFYFHPELQKHTRPVMVRWTVVTKKTGSVGGSVETKLKSKLSIPSQSHPPESDRVAIRTCVKTEIITQWCQRQQMSSNLQLNQNMNPLILWNHQFGNVFCWRLNYSL